MQQLDLENALKEATRGFYAALNQVLAGDPEPMLALWSHADDVTYMSPLGELLVGWAPIERSWRGQAEQIRGGPMVAEDLHVIAGAGLGMVVGFERGSVRIEGKEQWVDIRATSVYRLENARWMMVAHHTDRL